MKVNVEGRIIGRGRLESLVSEIITNMSKRIGVPEGTEVAIEALEFKVVFFMNGEENYATVPRTVNGKETNEMFMVNVKLDEDGMVIKASDNEAESYYDGFSLARAMGEEYDYSGVESEYNNDQLDLIESLGENSETDVMAVRYKVIANPATEVVRHYKGDLLVAEYVYQPKEK
jgi:hypothetical protein